MQNTHIIFAIDDAAAQDEMVQTITKRSGSSCIKVMFGGYIMHEHPAAGALVEETSFLIPAELWPLVGKFAQGQESILLLSEMHAKPELRKATLQMLETEPDLATCFSDSHIDLGWFQAVPGWTQRDVYQRHELASQYGGYTYDPSSGRYFVGSKTIL